MKLRASVWTVDPRDGEMRYQVRELDIPGGDVQDFQAQVLDEETTARGVDTEVYFGPIGPPWRKA
jgi:hypothetical protein